VGQEVEQGPLGAEQCPERGPEPQDLGAPVDPVTVRMRHFGRRGRDSGRGKDGQGDWEAG